MKFTVFYRNSFVMPFAPAPDSVNRSDYKEIAVVDTEDLETLFREMNVVDGTELPVKLRVRSLSVGDVALDEKGIAHYCASVGWTTVEFQ